MDFVLGLMKGNLDSIVEMVFNLGIIASSVVFLKGVLRQVVELLQTVLVALDDGKISTDEFKNIVKEAKDVVTEVKKIKRKP